MNVSRKRFLAKATATSFAALFISKQSAPAADGDTAPEIEGTWRFDNLPAPQGAAVSLQTFGRGGVFLESAVLIGGTTAIPRTTSQGAWVKIGPHYYVKTFEYFAERKSGEAITVLRVKVTEDVQVSGDFMTIGNATVTRYNLDGTVQSEPKCILSNAVGIRVRTDAPGCPSTMGSVGS